MHQRVSHRVRGRVAARRSCFPCVSQRDDCGCVKEEAESSSRLRFYY